MPVVKPSRTQGNWKGFRRRLVIGAVIGLAAVGAAKAAPKFKANAAQTKPIVASAKAQNVAPRQPLPAKHSSPKALPRKGDAGDFESFRKQQAARFGVNLTSGWRFKPSGALMREIKKVISKKCSKVGWKDKVLIYSFIEHESNFNPNARGADDKGLGQLNPVQMKQLKKLGFEITNPYDIGQNIEGVVRTVKWLDDNLKVGSSRQAFTSLSREQQLNLLITAYNRGIGTINKLGLGSFSDYTSTVGKIYRKNREKNLII